MVQPLMAIERVGAKRTGIHAGGKRQKYILDEPSRKLIQALYDGTTERINEIQRKLPSIPRWKIKQWACQMGLANQKELPWSEEEVQYLEKYLHRMSLAAIAKVLGRTKVAVQLKAKRLGLNKCHQEGYTMRGLCLGLGCDHHKVERWIANEWLKGTRRGTERKDVQGGDVWLFTDAAIRRLVCYHPEEIDLRRVDKHWFLDVIMGGYDGIGELGK